jgi:glycosyltransferase involved in cell wall biosynthesis
MSEIRPLVSIFIPVYNSSKYVDEAIRSAQNQTYKNLEIVISDDASTDGSEVKLKQLASKDSRIKLFIQEKNLGVTKNCNFLLKQCHGEYICFTAGDDVLAPECIERGVNEMNLNKDIAILFHSVKYIDSNSNLIKNNIRSLPKHYGLLKDFLKKGINIPINGMIVRGSFLMNCKFNESMPNASDFSLIWCILDKKEARFLYLNKVLSYYRIHEKSITSLKRNECTKEAMLENHKLGIIYPKYSYYSMKRTRKQALALIRFRGLYLKQIQVLLLFSFPVHLIEYIFDKSNLIWKYKNKFLVKL